MEAAHRNHPNSKALDVLHGALADAVAANKDELTTEQFNALGGGTPKTPPPSTGDAV